MVILPRSCRERSISRAEPCGDHQETHPPMSPAAYLGRPLVDKLGLKPGDRVKVCNAPADYQAMITPVPEGLVVSEDLSGEVDVWHLFTDSRAELEHMIPLCLREISRDGMIWVSWPKKASGVPSEINDNDIRTVARPLGLVDVKVCAVDDVWSGLKLMIRKELRRI